MYVSRDEEHKRHDSYLKKLIYSLIVVVVVVVVCVCVCMTCVSDLAPSYLQELLVQYRPSSNLRSQSKSLLVCPRINTQIMVQDLFNHRLLNCGITSLTR